MFTQFLPKEEQYFEHFNEMIKHIHDMAMLTQQFFSAPTYDMDILLRLKPLEKRCDEILTTVVRHLNQTFITPFDREDIFTLINRLDDISDILFGASKRVEIFKLDQPIEGADKLTAIISEQIVELKNAIHGLRKNAVSDNCKAVKDLEAEADVVYQHYITQLFENETDAINLIKKKEITDILENASDKCQAVASVIITILIKNA